MTCNNPNDSQYIIKHIGISRPFYKSLQSQQGLSGNKIRKWYRNEKHKHSKYTSLGRAPKRLGRLGLCFIPRFEHLYALMFAKDAKICELCIRRFHLCAFWSILHALPRQTYNHYVEGAT